MAKKKEGKSLEDVLWDCRVALRGVGSSEKNRDAIIGLVFVMFASAKFEACRQAIVEEYGEVDVFLEDKSFYLSENVYYLNETSRWSYLVQEASSNDIAVKIDKAMADIEDLNPEALKGTLPTDNFYVKLGASNSVIKGLIDAINKINDERFQEEDLIGRVYEYFLKNYAASGTKDDGEFYTPACVVKLIAELIEPFDGVVYDPCCGSGGMFVQSLKFVQEHNGQKANVSVIGQESNPDTWRLAKMNLAIRGIAHNLGEKNASTFTEDLHKDTTVDYIMANPPFNLKNWRKEDELLDDPRFKHAKAMPPVSNANYAWILHMLSKLDVTNGIAGFLLANGALNADGAEYEIRKQIIEEDRFFKTRMLNYLDGREGSYPSIFSTKEYFFFCVKVGFEFEEHSYHLLQQILKIRPDWGESRKSDDDSKLDEDKLSKLVALPKINLVATRDKDDEKEMFDALGNKAYKKLLEKQFKNNDSNFKIAIVVDMWITGFDVPSLAVMYIDKPLQRHTLIQTISRVNRVFEGKDKGIVVDYIGIKNNMLEAIKQYGNKQESPVDEINISLAVFRNHLKLIDDLIGGFNATRFFCGEALERLYCLNDAAEYVQKSKDMETRFMGLTRKMKAAYNICFPTGELTDTEIARAQFYLAIRSIIYKQTKGDAPDAEVMNAVVERMVAEAITCTGVENILDDSDVVDLFSPDFQEQLKAVKLPISKFNALLKILKKAITNYSHTNKVKAIEFEERLKKVVDRYNDRDNLVFTSEVVADFIDDLSDEILKIFKDLEEDKTSFEKMGITFEEKAFYDILVKVRDEHEFKYADEKCIVLAKEIKKLVDDKSKFANWSKRYDIKSQLQKELVVLLYKNDYPPAWNKEVFESVLEQAENFKRYN